MRPKETLLKAAELVGAKEPNSMEIIDCFMLG